MKFKLLLCIIFSFALLQSKGQTSTKPLNVAFLLVDGVYNTEVIAPFDVFQHTIYHASPGMKVFTVAPTAEMITTFEGLRIEPDYSFEDKRLPEIDVLVVASAEHSMDSDLENETLISFVRRTGKHAKYTLSLCDGAFVLAKAGLVDGKYSTTFPSDIPKYRKMFQHLKVLEDVSFVHDGSLITSAGGVKSYDAAMYLVELLYGKQVAVNLGKGLIINWNLDKISHWVNNKP
jgi:transcriptional regulator GlxA family with amidase domain